MTPLFAVCVLSLCVSDKLKDTYGVEINLIPDGQHAEWLWIKE